MREDRVKTTSWDVPSRLGETLFRGGSAACYYSVSCQMPGACSPGYRAGHRIAGKPGDVKPEPRSDSAGVRRSVPCVSGSAARRPGDHWLDHAGAVRLEDGGKETKHHGLGIRSPSPPRLARDRSPLPSPQPWPTRIIMAACPAQGWRRVATSPCPSDSSARSTTSFAGWTGSRHDGSRPARRWARASSSRWPGSGAATAAAAPSSSS